MRVAPGATGGLAGGGGDVLPARPGFGNGGGGALGSFAPAAGLVQSALLAVGFGRAAARAAADPPRNAEGWPVEFDITGVPSCCESLPAGVPVSTPPGICDVCEGGGGRRGGGLAVCAGVDWAMAASAADSTARRKATDRFTMSS
jgi:hypothetical protein